MAKLVVNLDIIEETINIYDSVISDIQTAMTEAEQAIEALKSSGWRSNASTEFFSNFDSMWKKNIDKRLQIVKHLRECLIDAKTDYSHLYSEASNVGNSL